MPRYRFNWANIDGPLLAELVGDITDPALEPADQLRRWYGARPTEDFIRECWPVLRDSWLSTSPAARSSVVDALTARGLGDLSLEVGNDEGALEYLRTLRNTAGLRSTVLREFIRSGEAPSPVATDPTENRIAPSPSSGLAILTGNLASSLAALEPEQFLILAVADDQRNRYVQFAAGGAEGMRAESVGDEFLLSLDSITEADRQRLLELGWSEPEADEPSNYWAVWSAPVPYGDVAVLATRTLEEVHGLTRPDELTYEAFESHGGSILLPSLGIRRRGGEPSPSEESLDLAGFVELVRQTVTAVVPDVEEGDDGSLIVPIGAARVWVDVVGDDPFIAVRSPVVLDTQVTDHLLAEVHHLNRQIPFARLLVFDDHVAVHQELLATEIEHLMAAIAHVGRTADELDDGLAERHGGRTLLGERRSRPRTGNFGYL